MNELTKLKTKRERIRCLTTALLTRVDAQLMDAFSGDLLEEYYAQLDAKEKTFFELDAKVEGQIFEEKAFEVEVEESEIWREKCISYKSKISKAIKRINQRERQTLPCNVYRSSCPTPSSDSGVTVTPLRTSPSNKEVIDESCLKIEDVRSLSTDTDSAPLNYYSERMYNYNSRMTNYDQPDDVVEIMVPDQLEMLTNNPKQNSTKSPNEAVASLILNERSFPENPLSPSPSSSVKIVRRCEDCGTDFQFETQLVKHRLEVHRDMKPFKCPYCKFTTSFKSSLMTHHRLHTGEKPFRCGICGERFRVRIAMKKHVASHKKPAVVKKPAPSAPLECQYCQFTTTTTQAMASHLRKHEGGKRDKLLTTESGLIKHLDSRTLERPFQCPMCSKEFTKKASLKSHVRNRHQVSDFDLPRETTYKPFKCNVCMARFKFRASLISHQKNEHFQSAAATTTEAGETTTVAESPPRMDDEKYSQAAQGQKRKSHASDVVVSNEINSLPPLALEKLSANVEPGGLTRTPVQKETDVGPPIEDLAAATVPSELTDQRENASGAPHENISSGRDSGPISKRMRQKPTVEPLRCKECSRDFQENYSFEKHCFEIHGDSKPYKCLFCEHSTSNSLLLFMHLRSHTGVARSQSDVMPVTSPQIFKCQICKDLFTSRISLRRHIRAFHYVSPANNDEDKVHLQEDTKCEPVIYECDHCKLAFPSEDVLENHLIETHHNGSNRFQCAICFKNFKLQSKFTNHLPTCIPSREKAFQCPNCPKRFASKGSLSKHLRKKHLETPSDLPNEIPKKVHNISLSSIQNESSLRILIEPLPSNLTESPTSVIQDSSTSTDYGSSTFIQNGISPSTDNVPLQRMPNTPSQQYNTPLTVRENELANKPVDAMASIPKKNSPCRRFHCIYCDRSFPRKLSLTLHTRAHFRQGSRKEQVKKSDSDQVLSYESTINSLVSSHAEEDTGIILNNSHVVMTMENAFIESQGKEDAANILGSSHAEVAMENELENSQDEITRDSILDNSQTEITSEPIAGKSQPEVTTKIVSGNCQPEVAPKIASRNSIAEIARQIVSGNSEAEIDRKSVSSTSLVQVPNKSDSAASLVQVPKKNDSVSSLVQVVKESSFGNGGSEVDGGTLIVECSQSDEKAQIECMASLGLQKAQSNKEIATHQDISCEICGRVFRSKYHLGAHMSFHREGNPYHCKKCDKRYVFKVHYLKHMHTLHETDCALHSVDISPKQSGIETSIFNKETN